ncbi:hypothetical protein BGW38_005817 [Lunasporangiospora selenospora]|uniref:Superoxide dismutase copper/zinc binding domain-containing protein n=1 Tax=Lunasporangiospora selenospora TaxID=979761 RepID=A0A9P6G4Z6_9FUNG|nr:hypothetical protein BGW38_005817 [Lunasporangiospora selenospora]
MNNIVAGFVFVPMKDGQGAYVAIKVMSGLTTKFAKSPTGGFEYHIHERPVGPNNNCSATGDHLDPTKVGVAIKCNPAKPESCQEGDLSGKHGDFMATESGSLPWITYKDYQLRFSGKETTIAGRSIVIHNNVTRVACANILPLSAFYTYPGKSADGQVLPEDAQLPPELQGLMDIPVLEERAVVATSEQKSGGGRLPTRSNVAAVVLAAAGVVLV